MLLSTLLEELANEHLSNLSFSKNGIVEPSAHARVIMGINSALNDIYTRILLLEKEVVVQTLEWKAIYHLRKQHARMDPTPGVLKYIIDTPSNPFTGDVVRALSVVNEVGSLLPLNDANQWASVFTPAFDTIQFNHPGADQAFAVQYQALHPKLSHSDAGYLDQIIHIPPVLLDMVKLKTASAIFAPMGGQEHSAKAQYLEAAYEARHAMLVQRNDAGDYGMSTNTKLDFRGYP